MTKRTDEELARLIAENAGNPPKYEEPREEKPNGGEESESE